jgi:hypothetical protein
MSNAGAFGSGAGLVDDVLGNAYLIVKHIYDNMTAISEVAARTDIIDDIKDNLDLAESAVLNQTLSIVLAGVTNYRATFAEALIDFTDGEYFSSAESGTLRLYKRGPGITYTDQGDVVAPVSRALLAATTGAALIGTSEAEINVEEALAARPKSTLLAGETGAALIGTDEEGINVQEALDARPTATDLAAETAGALIGSDTGIGTNVDAALTNLVPTDQTTGNLESLISLINTTGKFKGKFAWNTTTQKMVMALGASVEDGWVSMDGLSTYTPA